MLISILGHFEHGKPENMLKYLNIFINLFSDISGLSDTCCDLSLLTLHTFLLKIHLTFWDLMLEFFHPLRNLPALLHSVFFLIS